MLVVLPTEGVDRNQLVGKTAGQARVVLPTEGVDRNPPRIFCRTKNTASSSPRRAWIEIKTPTFVSKICTSSSPRRAWIEINSLIEFSFNDGSSSPRRAWIEILQEGDVLKKLVVVLPTEGVDRNIKERKMPMPTGVVLPTEGVDRNTLKANAEELDARRPPHGGRG